MRNLMMVIATASLLAGCAGDYGYERPARSWRSYDHNRPDPAYGGYDASRYYRDDPRYRERRLDRRDRIYRGSDDRYYCRRPDGTTGLIVGAIAGGILGNIIARGGSETLGTILGAGAGAVIGREIERDGVSCR